MTERDSDTLDTMVDSLNRIERACERAADAAEEMRDMMFEAKRRQVSKRVPLCVCGHGHDAHRARYVDAAGGSHNACDLCGCSYYEKTHEESDVDEPPKVK